MLCLGYVPCKTHNEVYICLVDLHEDLFHVVRSILALFLTEHKIETRHYATTSLHNITGPLGILAVKSIEGGIAQALYTLIEVVLFQGTDFL